MTASTLNLDQLFPRNQTLIIGCQTRTLISTPCFNFPRLRSRFRIGNCSCWRLVSCEREKPRHLPTHTPSPPPPLPPQSDCSSVNLIRTKGDRRFVWFSPHILRKAIESDGDHHHHYHVFSLDDPDHVLCPSFHLRPFVCMYVPWCVLLIQTQTSQPTHLSLSSPGVTFHAH